MYNSYNRYHRYHHYHHCYDYDDCYIYNRPYRNNFYDRYSYKHFYEYGCVDRFANACHNYYNNPYYI